MSDVSVEWRRLKPSGLVHAWDAHVPTHQKPALCGKRNVNGTTNVYPPACKLCPTCVALAPVPPPDRA